MHKQLEDYLAEVEKVLSPLPAARQEEELQEMRQHLLSAVDVNQGKGQSEDQAVADALRQFGGHQELGERVVSVWRRGEWRRRMGAAPELAAFAVFSSTITLSSLWLTFAGPGRWRETAFPYTGGSLATPYMFSLFFAWSAIFMPEAAPKVRLAPVALLLLCAVFGAEEYLRQRPLDNFHNPYLTVDPWQPVWTVALPLVWAAVLSTCPLIRGRKARQTAA